MSKHAYIDEYAIENQITCRLIDKSFLTLAEAVKYKHDNLLSSVYAIREITKKIEVKT